MLYEQDINLMKVVQTDTVTDSRFMFTDTVCSQAPCKRLLMADAEGFPNNVLEIWIQSGEYVKIEGKNSLLPLWKVSSRIRQQKDKNDFMALCPETRIRQMQLAAEEADVFRESMWQNPDWKKIDSIRNLQSPLDSLIFTVELSYMKEAPITDVWMLEYAKYLYALEYLSRYGLRESILALYSRLSETDKETATGKMITAYINLPEKLEVGDEMADSDLYDISGNLHHLSEFKGRYILLDFWCQGCGPCILSIPEMEEITAMYKDRLEVVSISIDSEKSWKEFIAKREMKGNQWNERLEGKPGLQDAYQVSATGIPRYVIINPEGKIQDMWSGYRDGILKEKLKGLQFE